MGTYIFYTDEGYTIAPNDEELDSLQVLGIEDGNSREEALANLYKNNEWIKENGFRELWIFFFRHPAMLQFLKCFPLFGYV